MRRLRVSRPSPAMGVALLALFISLGGVSYGVATGSIDTREIKNNTIKTKDIRNNDIRSRDIRNSTVAGRDVLSNTIRGADVLESSLGLVPTANAANIANRANSAASVDRLKSVAFKRVTASASNADAAAARSAAAEVALFSVGAFDVYGKCFVDTDSGAGATSQTLGEIFIRTRSSGAVAEGEGGDSLDGNPFLDTGTAETLRQLNTGAVGPNAGSTDFEDDATFGAAAPDGTAISGEVGGAIKQGSLPGGDGIYGGGNVCIFWGHAVG